MKFVYLRARKISEKGKLRLRLLIKRVPLFLSVGLFWNALTQKVEGGAISVYVRVPLGRLRS